MSDDDPLEGVEVMTRRQLQGLVDFELPRAPKWKPGQYSPPGPIGQAYIASSGPIDGIMGPGGSGKTVASAWKGIRFSLQTMPICRDGIVRVKGTVVRDNYRSLYRTTLQSWFDIFPMDMEGSVFSGGQDRPAVHQLRLETVRLVGGVNKVVPVDLRVEFFAIADVNYELLFKSYETSWAWATEADGLPVEAIPFFYSRTARFPAQRMLPPATSRARVAFFDLNPPDPEHPLLQACERGSFKEDFDPERDVKTINFFRQPSGLSDQAENRAGKSLAEYQAEMNALPRDVSRRMVEGKPGRQKSGLPVYDEEFERDRIVSGQPLPVLPHLPIHIGFDQGGAGGSAGAPGAEIFQQAPNGQIRFLDEVIASPGTGVERFLEALIPILITRFQHLPPGIFACDPSGFYGGDKVYGSLAWAEIVGKALGHRLSPAPSNEWTPRRESLAMLMTRSVSAGVPKMIVDPRCRVLIRGLSSAYKYSRRHDGTYDPRPIKNFEATAVEAAQYGVLGVIGLAGTIGQISQGSRPGGGQPFNTGVKQLGSDFSVWDV